MYEGLWIKRPAGIALAPDLLRNPNGKESRATPEESGV